MDQMISRYGYWYDRHQYQSRNKTS
jgi:hypothetical protein